MSTLEYILRSCILKIQLACFHVPGGTKVFALSRPLHLFLDGSAFPAPVALCLVILMGGQETKTMLSLTTFLKSLSPFAVLPTEIFFLLALMTV